MKIAFLVVKDLFSGGGIEKYSLELGSRLAQRGHQVRVYTTRTEPEGLQQQYPGIEVHRVRNIASKMFEKVSGSMVGVLTASIQKWADIHHLHSNAPGAFAWISRMLHTPCVVQFHGIEWKRTRWNRVGRWMIRDLERVCIAVNSHFTAVSRTQCQYYAKTYGIRVEYIPPGANIKVPAPSSRLKEIGLDSQRYLLFASRIVREKGLDLLLRAFRAIPTDCRLAIAGDLVGDFGYQRELLRLAGDDPRIVFLGFVRGPLLDELFSHALAYVQPSRVEGLSLALLEAMSYGLCCIVSNIPENVEAVGSEGMLFEDNSYADLEARIAWVLSNQQTVRGLGEKAREKVRSAYSWDDVAAKFEAFYHRILQA